MQDYLDKLIFEKRIVLLEGDEAANAKKFLKEAYIYAAANSDDNSTWTGAVAVKNDQIISKGANKFSVGVSKTPIRLEKPLKYDVLDHAERQCAYHAAKNGIALQSASLFTPWVPCCPCANSIISSGFSEIVLHYDKTIKTPNDWLKNVTEALNMLVEAGVQVKIYKGEIGGVENLFRGEIWNP